MFQEHVRFYTTKALTTVMTMRMLGNSMRGLSPRNKRTLYRACVLPIATYGHRLWYFEGAKVKGVLESLTSMQQKAVCWITGVFCTSPTGGVERLAGLPPISIHLKKLSQCAILRTATLCLKSKCSQLESNSQGTDLGDSRAIQGHVYNLKQQLHGPE
jgi:hypothetical protein